MKILPLMNFRINNQPMSDKNNRYCLQKIGYDTFTASLKDVFDVFPDFGTHKFFRQNLDILKSPQEIEHQIKLTAKEINKSYPPNEPLVAICVLRGGVPFFQNLVRYLDMPVNMEFISVSSYGSGLKSSGKVKISGKIPDVNGLNVLLVDDVMDSGNTMSALTKYFKDSGAKEVKTAVLFNKPDKRVESCKDLEPDFYGFSEKNAPFLIGYGLDLFGYGRGLPYIGAAKPEFLKKLTAHGLLDN